ncbi:recombinase family protein [Erythrobacter sp. CCH5-A1]|jgi:hypothetical protein|uniref:recombinase family protein n=1 Tax=Erythrobacter sp. CCH5-A1 TaxID=1768792 RepID=UPI000832A82B|nr:recombinase family protein [Erythrobacter sp. CCH5-A1]
MVIRWTDDNDEEPKPPSMIRAAQYVRMSTEHQQYSNGNQAATIAIDAQKRGLEIVKTYADEGKSGLNIKGRPALQALFDDIESGRADFKVLLVYYVSRRGVSRIPTRPPAMNCAAGRRGYLPASSKASSRRSTDLNTWNHGVIAAPRSASRRWQKASLPP